MSRFFSILGGRPSSRKSKARESESRRERLYFELLEDRSLPHTVGLFDSAAALFFERNTNTEGPADTTFQFGTPAASLQGIAGDWNNDDTDSPGVYNPATGTWQLRDSNTAGPADVTFDFGPGGNVGWITIEGDWDGDGVDTAGLYDPTNGIFFLKNSNTSGIADIAFEYGAKGAGWIPIVGDWDNNGSDTVALYDPAGSNFFLRNSNSAGIADVAFAFGAAGQGWRPIAGDWDDVGGDSAGLYVPGNNIFFLRNTNTDGQADIAFILTGTPTGLTPLAGEWLPDETAPTADIVDVAPDPRTTAVGQVTINFSEAVTGVDLADFSLTLDGSPVALTGVTVTTVSPSQYTLNLTTVSATNGTYVLTLNAAGSGIQDTAGNLLTTDASDTWVKTAATVTDLSGLNGTSGFLLNGQALNDNAVIVKSAGDVNGDGFDDVIIGAYDADANGVDSGAAYVVFGQSGGFPTALELSGLTGLNGFALLGASAGDNAGQDVSAAGDVNGDGFGDVIVGAPSADGNTASAGAAYVVFGASGGFASSLTLGTALNGLNGFTLNGLGTGGNVGYSVSSAGDFNGDGIADLLIGGPDAGLAGEVYVVFGQTTPFGATIDLSGLNGTNGFILTGTTERTGFAVSDAGDVNGDGFGDIVIGSHLSDVGATDGGTAYVVFGSSGGFTATSALTVASLDGTNGFSISSAEANAHLGYSVSGAGDVNGDGLADLIIGADDANGGTGAAYVVFGQSGGFSSALELSSLNGTNGFALLGEALTDDAGTSVSGAGDFNGDGFADLLIGAPYSDSSGTDAGKTYLVFGQSGGFAATLDLSAIDGTNGIVFNGVAANDYSGWTVSSGDINGDGFADALIGAFASPNGTFSGTSYVIFGGNVSGATTQFGTNGPDTLVGIATADVIIGAQGDDLIIGAGGADVLIGGEGDDILAALDAVFEQIAGGGGDDILRIDGTGVALDLTVIPPRRISGIEGMNLAGSGGNSLTLGQLELFALSDTSNTLTIDGNADDSVVVNDLNWVNGGVVDGYQVYTLGQAVLRINTAITNVTIDT